MGGEDASPNDFRSYSECAVATGRCALLGRYARRSYLSERTPESKPGLPNPVFRWRSPEPTGARPCQLLAGSGGIKREQSDAAPSQGVEGDLRPRIDGSELTGINVLP